VAADGKLSFFQMWTALMTVLGKTHRFKYQDGKALKQAMVNRMNR
jgi:hypothetical protein